MRIHLLGSSRTIIMDREPFHIYKLRVIGEGARARQERCGNLESYCTSEWAAFRGGGSRFATMTAMLSFWEKRMSHA